MKESGFYFIPKIIGQRFVGNSLKQEIELYWPKCIVCNITITLEYKSVK